MKYRAIFLDMDHTLCDTERADILGMKEFQNELSSTMPRTIALRVGSQYLSVIYGEKKSNFLWQKHLSETESSFRARLLMQVIKEESTINISCKEVTQMANRFMHLRVKHFGFFPGTIEMLTQLRENHTLVLISNGPLFSQKPKVEKVAMHQHVDHIILGGELQEQKPHPSIFHLACKKACCSPGEAIHIGDMLESDILGAINAGIDNVWVGSKAKIDQGPIKPDYIIAKITELKGLLERIENGYID